MLTGNERFDYLFYVRLIEACNLRCKHCYIPPNPKTMSWETVATIPKIISSIAEEGQRIIIRIHGGEPTLIPPKKMRKIINEIKKDNKFEYEFEIQTNLINYNDEWKDLFRECFSSVGVSWDYGIRVFSGQKTDSNERFERIFWENMGKFIDDGFLGNLTITGTKLFFESFRGFSLFEFLESKRIESIHIEKITPNGYALENWDKLGLTNKEFSDYMSRVFQKYQLWCSSKNRSLDSKAISISPLDGIINSVQSLDAGKPNGGYGCWSGVCDTRLHTIDANGYKLGCTAINAEYDNVNVQKMGRDEVIKFVEENEILRTRERRRKEYDCASCEFASICSAACMASSSDDGSGECSGNYSLFKTVRRLLPKN